METIGIGGSGLTASRVGLGTWAIGGWMWGGSEEAQSIETIRAAVERGVTLIDTAPVYGFGRSEEIVGGSPSPSVWTDLEPRALLLAAQGVWVRNVQLQFRDREIWIGVEPRGRIHRCGSCGREARQRHDRAWRWWRHLDVFGWRCYLRYQIRRVRCRHCGVRTESVPWAAAGSRFSRDFEQQVAWLAQRCDLTAVKQYFRISWPSVRRIVDRAHNFDRLRVRALDEDLRRLCEQWWSSAARSMVPALQGEDDEDARLRATAERQRTSAIFPEVMERIGSRLRELFTTDNQLGLSS